MARTIKYLADLLLDVYTELGQVEFMKVTGTGVSATTTFRNSLLANRSTPKQANYARDWYAFVFHDAGGAGAAPEGQYQRISAYTSTDYEYTVEAAFTAALAVGDIIGIASTKLVPFLLMRKKANDALLALGQVELVDTSLSTADNQTEYTLPAGITRDNITNVMIQTYTSDANDNSWIPVAPWDVHPAAPGTQHTLVIPQYASGYTLKIFYKDYHPELSVYNSVVSETIDYPLLVKQLKSDMIDWINKDGEGSSKYWLSADGRAAQELAVATARHPMPKRRMRGRLLNLRPVRNNELSPDDMDGV